MRSPLVLCLTLAAVMLLPREAHAQYPYPPLGSIGAGYGLRPPAYGLGYGPMLGYSGYGRYVPYYRQTTTPAQGLGYLSEIIRRSVGGPGAWTGRPARRRLPRTWGYPPPYYRH